MTAWLYLDTETYSPLDLKAVGTYRYAESAQVMLLTWAINDEPVRCWDHSEGTPAPDLAAYVEAHPDVVVVAHNAMFDRTVLRLGDLRLNIPLERWRCTMVQAMQHALPGSLDELGRVLGLPDDAQKLGDGKKLINRFCKPAPRNHKADRYDRHSHPAEWARFRDYAVQDVAAMREIHRRLPTWNWQPDDVAAWHLDQRINDRGFAVDVELAEAGARAAGAEKLQLQTRFAALTGGLQPTQRAQVQAYLNSHYGLTLESTAKHILEPIAADDTMPAELREIARIMLSANKSSTAKYASIAAARSTDDRFRGGLQFAGAARTRRWAGRTFQPQNLPSRGLPDDDMIEAYIHALKAGCHADGWFEDLMLYGAAALRGVVRAPDGGKLVVSDLSNIEGRVLAWLAGETWKLDAFRAFDAGEGPDLYNVTAASILGGSPYDVEKKNRNVFGKVPDLALGYEGGAGALQTFAKAYGVQMADYWSIIEQSVDIQHVIKAHENLRTWGASKPAELEISETEWLASETVKLAWRGRHEATRRLWYAAKDAAVAAIRAPGRVFQAGAHLQLCCMRQYDQTWLLVLLPSGKYLTYFDPRVDDGDNISYMGYGNENGQTTARIWCRVYTYGGKIVENACQALAGDVLKHSMPAAEAAGYQIVLTVHDEEVTQTPDSPAYSADQLSAIMAGVPDWAPGLPLAAAGFEDYRYKKD